MFMLLEVLILATASAVGVMERRQLLRRGAGQVAAGLISPAGLSTLQPLCACAAPGDAIAGEWALAQEVKEGLGLALPPASALEFRKSGEVLLTYPGGSASSAADFEIRASRGLRSVTWTTEYEAATLLYMGVVKDAEPSTMAGDIFELDNRGGAGAKVGAFRVNTF